MTRPARPVTAYAGTRIRGLRMHNPGLGIATPTIFMYENHLIE